MGARASKTRISRDYWQRPSLPTHPPRQPSFEVVGAVTLVQAARTKEVIARIRRETGRRDMGAFSIEAGPEATANWGGNFWPAS